MAANQRESSEAPATPGSHAAGSLTSEIFDQFAKDLLNTGLFTEAHTRKLLAIASSESKPRPKDIEALLAEEDSLG